MKAERIICDCHKCQRACTLKPGLFHFKQMEKLVKYFKKPIKKIFNQYLGVEYLTTTGKMTLVLAPSTLLMEPGEYYPFINTGKCIFFKNNRCEIHKVAPYECQFYVHDMDKNLAKQKRYEIIKSWEGKEKFILELNPQKTPPFFKFL